MLTAALKRPPEGPGSRITLLPVACRQSVHRNGGLGGSGERTPGWLAGTAGIACRRRALLRNADQRVPAQHLRAGGVDDDAPGAELGSSQPAAPQLVIVIGERTLPRDQ